MAEANDFKEHGLELRHLDSQKLNVSEVQSVFF